jgi:demethylmenaquinone methyltransferase/2-methoxy-6-polyprenyl-1,4-benzoquinol methylase
MGKLSKDSAKIEAMFSSIAPRYDLLNRLLSLGRDRYWRRFAVGQLPGIEHGTFLDAATGTGDIAIEIAKRHLPGVRVTGIDLSDRMLALCREKIRRAGYQDRIDLHTGDLNSLEFKDNTFDAAIIAFGIRNVDNYKKAIKELTRVIKDGGKLVILEFTSLQNRFFKGPYRLYISRILPFISSIISGRRSAYQYLSASVVDFPPPEELSQIIEEAGLREVKYYTLTFGVTTVHTGIK